MSVRSKRVSNLPCEKICISLPAECMTQLAVIASQLRVPGISRSSVIAACITQVYEEIMIEENK